MSRQPPLEPGAPPLPRVTGGAAAVEPGGGGRGALDDFEALFLAQYEHMVRVAYLLLGTRAEAEDVVAESFARVDLRWARLANPGGYLRRCVVNASMDVLRRRRIERRFVVVSSHERRAGAPGADEVADEMSDALASLAPRRRAAVVLRYYGGLRDHEIAEVLGVRPGTVKSLLHRALADLRRVIER